MFECRHEANVAGREGARGRWWKMRSQRELGSQVMEHFIGHGKVWLGQRSDLQVSDFKVSLVWLLCRGQVARWL